MARKRIKKKNTNQETRIIIQDNTTSSSSSRIDNTTVSNEPSTTVNNSSTTREEATIGLGFQTGNQIRAKSKCYYNPSVADRINGPKCEKARQKFWTKNVQVIRSFHCESNQAFDIQLVFEEGLEFLNFRITGNPGGGFDVDCLSEYTKFDSGFMFYVNDKEHFLKAVFYSEEDEEGEKEEKESFKVCDLENPTKKFRDNDDQDKSSGGQKSVFV